MSWSYTDAWEKHVYAHLMPPNAAPVVSYNTATFQCDEGDGAMNPTSNHPGGVNQAMMDGSVRFIKNTIGLPTWWALGTKGAGRDRLRRLVLTRPGPPPRGAPTVHRLPTLRRLAALSLVALPLLGPGCGGEPTFDPATAYSPESLAAELTFRYKDLDPAKRNQPKAARPTAATKDARAAATKQGPATTLDDLVRETAAKADLVPGMARPEAIRKVAEAVEKDETVAPDDRKAIAERLRGAAGGP